MQERQERQEQELINLYDAHQWVISYWTRRLANKMSYLSSEHLKDLQAEGRYGLLQAIKTWDKDKAKLSTWASMYIRRRLRDYMRTVLSPIKQPRDDFVKAVPLSLSTPVADSLTLEDILISPIQDDPSKLELLDISKERLNQAIEELPKKEAIEIRYRYGIGVKQLSGKERAKVLKTTRQNIDYRIQCGLERLKKALLYEKHLR